MLPLHIVWFKRDLRIEDNEVLYRARQESKYVLPLYIIEPELWKQPDMSFRHYAFLKECVYELNVALTLLGQPLIIKKGHAIEIFQSLATQFKIEAIWSHQETWNSWTYERDKCMMAWCDKQKLPWHELTQNGVIRRLKSRDGWAQKWNNKMKRAVMHADFSLAPLPIKSEKMPTAQSLALKDDQCTFRQAGGRKEGIKLLHSFLYERGEHYSKEMSSPITGFNSCSRISPYLAFGTLSLKETFQTCEKRYHEVIILPFKERGQWTKALRSFTARLHWHCHFMQKLEDAPHIEFKNLHPAYNKLRKKTFNEEHFNAWKNGMTGYPMVDACMRALIATGWLNFRMRAMLMSFSSYHLWLDWKKPALYLAQLFTDYEPGIHYSQIQMQSGTTGINSIRIYNPIKQGIDQDPEGIFIRQWIPELADMPTSFIHTPWLAPLLMKGYPFPIIDEREARIKAATIIYALRKEALHTVESEKIITKHGSRKSGLRPLSLKTHNKKIKENAAQLELPL